MAKRIEYFIDLQGGINKGLKADLAQMQQDVRDIGGELYKLSDTRVHVRMEFDKSYDDFVQKVQQLVDAHPILGVQFQYDINKKLLDQDIAEIANSNDLKHALVVRYKDIAQQIQASFKALSENPDDAKISNDLNSYIKQFNNIINLIDEIGEKLVSSQTDTKKVFKDDKDTIEGFAKHYNAILKQFNSSINVFEKTDTGAARKEVEKYANELQSLMSVMDKIKDYGFSEKTRGKVDQYATSISSSVALPGVDELSKYARQIEAIHNNLKAYVKDGANPDFREPHEFKSELDEIDKQILERRVTIEAEIVPEKGSVEKLEEELNKEKPKKKVAVGGKSGGGSSKGNGGTVIDGDATHIRALPTINNAAEYVAELQKQIDEAQATVRVKATPQQDNVKKIVKTVKQQPVEKQTEQLPSMAQRSANLFEEQLKRAQAFALALSNEIGESGKKSKVLDDSLVRILDHFKNLASTRTAIRDIFDQSKSAEAMEASAKRAKQFADSIQYAAGYAKNLGEMRTIMRDLNGTPQTQQITTAMDSASQGAQQFTDQIETGLQTTISLADVTKRLVEYFERIQSMDLGRFYRNATATEDKIIDSVAYDVTGTRQQKYEIIPYRPDQSSAAEFVEMIEGQIHNSGDVDVSVHLKPDAAVVLINELQAQIDAAPPVNVPVTSQPESGAKLASDVQTQVDAADGVKLGIKPRENAGMTVVAETQSQIDSTDGLQATIKPKEGTGATIITDAQGQVDATDGIKTIVKPKDDVGTTIVSTVQTQVDATDGIKLKIDEKDENVIDSLAKRMQAYNDAFQKTQSDIPNVLNSTQEQFTNSKPLIIPIKAKESVASEIISKIRKQFSDATPLIIPVKAKESTASDITRAIREKWTNKKPLFIDVKAKTDSLDTVNTQIREKIKDIPLSVKAAANTGEKLVKEVSAQIAASDMRATIKVAPDQTSVTSFVNAVQKEIDAQKGTAKVSKAPRMLTAQQITKLTDQEGLLEKHRNIVTEVAKVEADALEKVKQSAADLNKEISSGIKELGASLKEIKRLEKEGKINAGSKPRKIDAGIQSQLDMIVGGVTSLRKDEWSDSLKGTYDQAVDSMNKLVDSYKDGTINLSQLKSAASDYTKTLKSQAKAEENAAKAAENKAKQEQSKATREQDKASTEAKREQNGEIGAGIKLLQEELKLRREIYNLELKQAGKREDEISETDKYAIDLRRKQADRMHTEANNIFDKFTLTPKQELDRSRITSEINDLEERIVADVAAKAEADAKKRIAKLGTVVATEIGNTRPEIQAALDNILSKHPGAKLLSPFDMSTGNAIAEWKDEDNIIQRVTLHYDENTKSIYLNNKAQREAETTLTRVGTSFRKMTDYFIRYVTTYMTLQRVLSGIRQGFTYVRDLDKALTELQLVTRSTDQEVSRFSEDAYRAADAVASTTTEVVRSATEWARLGYTMEDSLALATNSAKLAKAGFMEVADATSELTSSLQAFYGGDIQQGLISAGDAAAEISDKLVYIGNNYAITAQGLGEGMQRSAAALVAAGNDINEAIALTTAGNIIQQDPNSVSNALKVVSMRLRGTNASGISAELGEEVDLVDTSFSKLYKTVKELTSVKENDFQGISILTDSGAYKSTYQILLEISEVWDKISDANQAALLEQLAGKTRGAVVAGILQNGKAMESALADAQNAAGATDKAMETAMDSIEAKINQLQNTWQKTWQDLLDSDMVKGVIDAVQTLAEALDKLIGLFDKLPGSSTGLVALLSGVQSVTGRLRHIGSGEQTRFMGDVGGMAISAIQNRRMGIRNYGDVEYNGQQFSGDVVRSLFDLQQESKAAGKSVFDCSEAIDSLIQTEKVAATQGDALKKALNESKDGVDGLVNASVKAGKSLISFNGILAGIGQTLVSMGISWAATFAIELAIKAYDSFAHAAENAVEKAKVLQESVEEQSKQYQENIKTIEGLSERYSELSKGVDEYGNNVSLTSDEYKEYKDIVDKIMDISPGLQLNYSAENELLGEKADLITRAVNAQKELNREMLREQTLGSSAETWINGLGGELDLIKKGEDAYTKLSSPEAIDGLRFDIGDYFVASNEYNSGEFSTIAEWISNELGEALSNIDISDPAFFEDNAEIIRENIKTLINSLTPEQDLSELFYESKNDLQSWIVDIDDYNSSLDDLEKKVDEGLKIIVQGAKKADQLTEFEKQLANHYAESFSLEDITKNSLNRTVYDAGAYEEIRTSIENYTNSLTTSTIRLYEDAIKKLDESDSIIVSDYENALLSFLLGIQDELDDLGIELSVPDIGLQLGFFVEDANGNPTKSIQQKKDLIRKALIDEGFDLDHITVGELNRMANVAVGLPAGEKMTSANMLNQSTAQIAKMRLAEESNYTDATVSIEAYSSALSIANKTQLDNVAITADEAGTIREAIGADTDWSEAIEEVEDSVSGETKYIVKNSEALKKLITTSADANSVQGKLAKTQDKARKKYYELTKELTKVIKSTDEYNDATKAHIYNLSDQIADVRRLIDSYANLEQQLLGTTNAFTEFADAQELEAANNWGDQFTGFINTFADNLEKGEAGKPTTLAAIRAILPEEMRRSMTPEEQLRATVDIIEQAIADGYLSVNEDGNVEFLKENWTKFIEDGLKNGALIGTDVGHYELSDAISSLDDLAAAYGDKLSEEFLFALVSKGSDFNVAGTNVLSELLDDTSDEILNNIDALTLAQEKYVDVISDGASSAEDIRSAYNDVLSAQDAVDSMGQDMVYRAQMIIEYERELADLDEALSNPDLDDASLEQIARQYASISESLGDLGGFDQLQLDVALGQLDTEISDYQEKADLLSSIVEDISSQIKEAESEGTEHQYLDSQLADANAALEEVNAQLESTEKLRAEIFAKFSDDTTSVMDELESISQYEIDNKRFKVICDGNNANKTLSNILQKINRINDAHIKVDGAIPEEEGTSNVAGTFGRSYANGRANDLVGELGQEMVVDPSSGRYYTVGDNGPEMIDLPADAIVFNAKQTKDLLHQGHTSTRGKALADGTSSKELWSRYRALVANRVEQGPNYVGNVDINNRPIVLNSDGSYSTTATMFQEGWFGDEASGGYRIAHFTPILSDGTWLSDDQVGEYINSILQQQDPMAADANGYGIVYKIDTDIDGQKITDANIQAAFEMADSWDIAMHELQNAIYKEEAELKTRLYGNPVQRLLGNSYANGKANDLVGELGRELVVDPSTGRYYTVGDNGPEMVDLPANAIVYNARQTKDILDGGKAFVEGNAYNGKLSGGGTGGSNEAYEYRNGVPGNFDVSWRSGSKSSSSAAEAEAKEWYEAFEKAYKDLKKLRDDDVIDADEYYRRLQALYTDYYDKYGAASEENAEKLRDAWKQMYEDEKSDLEDQYSEGEIGTREYLDRLRNLYQRFYKDIPGFAKEAAKAQRNYLKTLQGEYQKLFSAAVSIIGDKISAIQAEYDAAVEAVEKERDAVLKEYDNQIKAIDNQIKGYEKQIKAIQKEIDVYEKEIDAIQKANEERQDAIDLQKAQYELARAQNQRTQHVYTSEKGFVYRANPQDVREAQNNLEDKQQELRIKAIQKEIDKLEEVIDGYNEKIDLLNEEKEHIQELKDAADEYYDSVIEGLKNTYEPMIKHFEEMQRMWQTFIDAEELAENIGVLKTFGISVGDILNTTAGDIGAVKEKYEQLLAALYADNPEMLSAFSQVFGTDLSQISTNIDDLGTTIDNFGAHLPNMTHPWGEVMAELGKVPEELSGVVAQSAAVLTEGQQPIDHYIQYIIGFEEELNKAGIAIGDFWDENGMLRDAIDQEAFNVYVESWNALNEAMQEAPGNMGQVSPLLESIKNSTLTPDQVMNYTSWLNEMNAGMPNAAESMGVMADNMASLSSADISGVTGKMGEMLAESNVKNALSLSQSLPGVADGVTALDGKNLDGVVSLSDILSESNAANAATLGTNLGTVATGVNDISGTDLSNASTQMSTLAGNAQSMSDLATQISSVSSSISGMNVSPEILANFSNFVDEFINKANAFKTQVQAIFGGGGGGEIGTNANGEEGSTGGEGGSGGWFDGLIQQMADLNAQTEEWLNGDEGLLAKWTEFRDNFIGIIGPTSNPFEDVTIVDTLQMASAHIEEELGHWLEVFTNTLEGGENGEGLKSICEQIAEAISSMCSTISQSCADASGAIASFSGALSGLAEAGGTAAASGYLLLNYDPTTRPWYSEADGTAHADGTALAGGRWGLPSNQRGTLVGELGPETLIRNGRYTVIGATGPERLDLRKGDIILNHKQTEQIFKYGRATGRGKAYASGTANNLDGLVKSSTPSFFDKFVNIVRDIGSDIKVMKPELHRIELAVAGAGAGVGGFGSTTTNTIENINVSLPSFNSSKADDLINDLQSLSLQAIQRFNRK